MTFRKSWLCLTATTLLAGCGTAANTVWLMPAEGGKRVYGGVKADIEVFRAASAGESGIIRDGQPVKDRGRQIGQLVYATVDLPFSAIGDTLTLPLLATPLGQSLLYFTTDRDWLRYGSVGPPPNDSTPVTEVADSIHEPVYYFPVQKDTKWVYGVKFSGKEESELVQVVTDVKDGNDGAKLVTIGRTLEDGKIHPVQTFEVSRRGLFWTENLVGQPLFGGPVCELKLPHKPGQRWQPGELTHGMHPNLTAHGPEKVLVPAGEFECIRVEGREDWNQAPSATRWYTPGIGEVKVKSGDLLIVLKSFTPGKD